MLVLNLWVQTATIMLKHIVLSNFPFAFAFSRPLFPDNENFSAASSEKILRIALKTRDRAEEPPTLLKRFSRDESSSLSFKSIFSRSRNSSTEFTGRLSRTFMLLSTRLDGF
uniref:Uncharacterized protein n=1 Tax=Cacopsylla melanoneura TaxID=428564 RepID=A0A8D9AV92_9HEMI